MPNAPPLTFAHRLASRLRFGRQENPILIYQMGKVGSSAISDAFESLGYPVVRNASKRIRRRAKVVHTHNHDAVARYMPHRRLDRDQFVITGVRDVLSRNISAFFQNFADPASPWWYFGTRDDIEHARMKDLIEFFNARHPAHLHDIVEPWFDRFGDAVGVDLFAQAFPMERGCLEIEAPVNVFVYRIEDLQRRGPDLARFLGKPELSIRPRNVGSQKWYAQKYRDFTANYKPDRDVLDTVYGSRIMRHFYSRAERTSAISKWT
jgi:hypothetical protein